MLKFSTIIDTTPNHELVIRFEFPAQPCSEAEADIGRHIQNMVNDYFLFQREKQTHEQREKFRMIQVADGRGSNLLIESQFEAFKKFSYGGKPFAPEQYQQLLHAFYCGFCACFEIIRFSSTKLPKEKATKTLDAIETELTSYFRK